MYRLFIFLLFFGLIDLYAFQGFKTLTKSRWMYIAYFLLSAIVVANFFYQLNWGSKTNAFNPVKNYAFGALLVLIILKLMVIPVLFIEDIIRLFTGIYQKYWGSQESFFVPSRRKFVSQIALGLAAIPVASLLYGMYKGRYNFKVLNYTLHFEDLPEAFDGYKITQISDIHSGSLDHAKKIEYAVNLINEQQSDAILFTGDLVNNIAEEIEPWVGHFSKLTAKDGVYSVLGNHDYGDYVRWENDTHKVQNLNKLKQLQADMGFDLLLNEHRVLERKGEKLVLVGVENWGKGFKQKGDLDRAIEGLAETDFKVLMSHDPTHWSEVVLPHKHKFQLTLSGHTHGMQFGIEIPGWIKWSPVKWRYKHWAGIYEQAEQYLNVNRGFGVLAYPGRVGIWPEVTVIELRRGAKQNDRQYA